MLKRLILWGGTGQAKVLRELTARIGYEVVAVFDNNSNVPPPFPDVPIYYGREGFQKWWGETSGKPVFSLVAIAGARGKDRMELQGFLESAGAPPITAVHPTAFVASDAFLSKGCQILAHARVCAQARLGEACIINTGASVDHECVLAEGVHVAPGAILGGCVQVGRFSMIALGANVLPWLKIGSNVIVGAGAVVTEDIPDGKVAYGVPARCVRDNV